MQRNLYLRGWDARLIVQVLINMVDNAVKYTPCGSEIRISSRKKGKWVEISVADNGPGIPDEQKPRIFDTFFSGTSKLPTAAAVLGWVFLFANRL